MMIIRRELSKISNLTLHNYYRKINNILSKDDDIINGMYPKLVTSVTVESLKDTR